MKLENFKKIPETLGFDGEYAAVHPKPTFWQFSVKNCKKSAVKHSVEKAILLILWICLQRFVQDCK